MRIMPDHPRRKSALEGGAKARAARRRHAAPKFGGDPSVSDREYSADELELLMAVDAWKARTGRKFPTNCDLLQIFRSLGYHREAPATRRGGAETERDGGGPVPSPMGPDPPLARRRGRR